MILYDAYMFTSCFIQYHLPPLTSLGQEDNHVGLPWANVISLNIAMEHLPYVRPTLLFRMGIHAVKINGSVLMDHALVHLNNVKVYLVKVFITS